ncbi:nucleotide exchange factor GrpE [Candidatus Uhrbacteria bacterium RIFOXYC2_FULL_47_19]|uniref:Protein GrpE n=1 Tax=Candidatus Uhrbacteria bacterium RIFOXYC2_FULL_47_19 TaxID=1802424 RepID=A0A1F7WFL6_9BACT|nr:MAG: nucleotide exchange factor GrpE [Candidatus Uhrbacteria bacterium RIFOXYC2_FULL_47_19]HCC22124.1 nucleotide exchange factor GrpE [Candidatus Uhrbacteria bacterium]
MDDHQQDEEQLVDDNNSVGSEVDDNEVANVTDQNLDYKDSYLRVVADYDNLKKETVRLRGEYARYAATEMIREFLPVYDNLKKALEHAPTSSDCTKWTEGIGLIVDQCGKVLTAAGVQVIDEVDILFDPSVHEALMREKHDSARTDTVIKIVEPGYRLHDRVLRPAKVIVAE